MPKIFNSPYLELETVCFTITSAPDDICGEYKEWFEGKQISILQNGNPVSTIPAKFSHFYKCFSWHKDVVFEFKPQDGDGVSYSNLTINSTKVVFQVCITSFFVNDRQLLFGQYSQLKAFWIDADKERCHDDVMFTTILKIKNGEVIESECKPNTASTVASANDANDDNVVDGKNDETSTMADIYKCTDDWKIYANRKIDQTTNNADKRFSNLEEAKTACMNLPIDDCIGIGEDRGNEDSIVFGLKRSSKFTDNENKKHTSYIRPKCRPDGQ